MDRRAFRVVRATRDQLRILQPSSSRDPLLSLFSKTLLDEIVALRTELDYHNRALIISSEHRGQVHRSRL